MKKEQIIQKVEDGIRRCYHIAQSVYPRVVSWDEINTPEVAEICKGRGFIWSGFFITKKEFDQIVKDLSKGTRYSWRWPRRTEMGKDGKIVPDPEWNEYQAAYEIKSQELADKKISRKEFNEWLNEMGEKYHMQRRNYDRETIEFNIWNVAPTTIAHQYIEIELAYKELELGQSPEVAAKMAVPVVNDIMVEKEYESRLAMADKYESSEEFRKTFLDKEEIRKSLESDYENRINVVSKTVEMLKEVWDKVLSKK